MTANEPCVSTDLASRAILVELRQPAKSAAWDERLEALLADPAFLAAFHADVAWHLAQRPAGYTDDPTDRWALWWMHVGFPACGSADVLHRVREVVRERRGDVDGDRAGREDLAAAIWEVVRAATFHHPDGVVAFLPAAVLARILTPLLGKKVTVTEAGNWMSVMAPEHLYRERTGPPAPGGPVPRVLVGRPAVPAGRGRCGPS